MPSTLSAVSGEVTSTGSASGRSSAVLHDRGRLAHAVVRDGLRDRRHRERRRKHLALADRRLSPRATSLSISPRLEGGTASASSDFGRGQRRLRVEAECLGRLDHLLGPDVDAQRGENGVARVGEAPDEGAAAGRIVGVRDLSADVRLFDVSTGNSSSSATTPASRPAVAVMILKVEPGGCGAENARPATPRTSPVFASITATPPYWSPSAVTAAVWTSGSMVVLTSSPGVGLPVASVRFCSLARRRRRARPTAGPRAAR